MSKRLEILNASLAKKESVLDQRFANHFESVKSANGQPLNDKRNGQATLNKWGRQNDAIRNQISSIEITKSAIDKEESKVLGVYHCYEYMPQHLKELIDSGTIKQWRKHPHIMFVAGVEKARIYWDKETNICSHKYVKEIPNKEQYAVFRDVYNSINAIQSKHNAKFSGVLTKQH